jgi:hypothetical protein
MAEVAAHFLRYRDPSRREFAATAYCEEPAEEAANRLSYPWLESEGKCLRFPVPPINPAGSLEGEAMNWLILHKSPLFVVATEVNRRHDNTC